MKALNKIDKSQMTRFLFPFLPFRESSAKRVRIIFLGLSFLCLTARLYGGSSIRVDEATFSQAEVLSEHAVRLPFTLAGRLLTFDARINGVKGKLILDTGCEALLLNGRYFEGKYDGSLEAFGQTGRVQCVNTSRLDSIGWGGFCLRRLVRIPECLTPLFRSIDPPCG